LRDGSDDRAGLILHQGVATMEYGERREGLQLAACGVKGRAALRDGDLRGADQAGVQRLVLEARCGQLAVERVEEAGFAGDEGFAGGAELTARVVAKNGCGQFCAAALPLA